MLSQCWWNGMLEGGRVPDILKMVSTILGCSATFLMLVLGSSLPLIFCIDVCSGPIYWGGYLPCKNIIR
jgi:hypothetical protein